MVAGHGPGTRLNCLLFGAFPIGSSAAHRLTADVRDDGPAGHGSVYFIDAPEPDRNDAWLLQKTLPGCDWSTTLEGCGCPLDVAEATHYVCAWEEEAECVCRGMVHFGRKYVSGQPGEGATTTLEQMHETPYSKTSVSGSVACAWSSLGGDPLGGFYKFCYCVPQDKPLPSLVVAGVAKGGTSTLMRLLKACSPAPTMPPHAAQAGGEAMYWIPELLPIVDDEAMGWRGWRCGDSTSFARAVDRVRSRPECSADGYRAAVWGLRQGQLSESEAEEHTSAFTVEKTPDYIIWPHAHIALRELVASGTKIVLLLRSPLQRLMSHYKHFFPWLVRAHNGNIQQQMLNDTVEENLRAVLEPKYLGSFGATFEEYMDKLLTKRGFVALRDEMMFHLRHPEGSRVPGAVDAYTAFLYSLCDATDWHASCALKRGALQSLYFPQLLSMLRYVGGCPSRWLRVIQSEQLFLKPVPVLRELWRWLGVKGPLSLNHTKPGQQRDKWAHRRRHLMSSGLGSQHPQLMRDAHRALSVWDTSLANLLDSAGIALTPFDLDLWQLPDAR